MIIFRKLNHDDYEDILDISKYIWDGLDYLPQLFHNWVDDKGIFLGAIDTSNNNKVVAVAKLSILSDRSGWLEGLRVHINYRGQKLAKQLTEILIKEAKKLLNIGTINKIAFSTHLSSIESRTMMESFNFSISEAQTLVLKDVTRIPAALSLKSFRIEPWEISYEEFKKLPYLKNRKNLLPLAFVFHEVTEDLFYNLKKQNAFVKINGHYGVFKEKGEPNFLAFEDTLDAIDTFMNYYLLSYTDKGIKEIYTPVQSQNTDLLEQLKSYDYYSWCDWQPDYLYYVLRD